MDNTNTHYYDKQLASLYLKLREYDDAHLEKPTDMNNSCQECFQKAQQLGLEGRKLRQLAHVLQMLSSKSSQNYDPLNNIHVHDLFPRVWRFVRQYDPSGLRLFYEQLIDILGGQCAQGRTTRLFQFYQIHINPPS